MNTVTVSVIIPVYNSEKHLNICIDSVLAQTYSDFELLLINDGSTDSSGAICDYYAEKDSRVKVFHKENGGVSSARNAGMKNATGSWICFIDSDDFIEEDYLESFRLNINVASELIVSGYSIDDKVHNVVIKKEISNFNNKSFYDIVPKLENEGILSSVCFKLFDSNVIKLNILQFNENFRFGEDTLFLWSYLMNIKTIDIINSTGYHYVKYDSETLTSISNTYSSLTEVNEEIFKLKKSFKRRIECKIIKKKFDKDIYYEYTLIWLRACISMYGKKHLLRNKKHRISNWSQFSNNVRIELLPETSTILKVAKYLLIKGRVELLDVLFRLWGLIKR